MIFVDASALVTILCREGGYVALADRIRSSRAPITSALAVFETVMAVGRKNGLTVSASEEAVRAFMTVAGLTIVSIADNETRIALVAQTRFGKGRGHPAQLNMGDCFAYACARTHDVPLLFVGNDLSQTDIPSAMP